MIESPVAAPKLKVHVVAGPGRPAAEADRRRQRRYIIRIPLAAWPPQRLQKGSIAAKALAQDNRVEVTLERRLTFTVGLFEERSDLPVQARPHVLIKPRHLRVIDIPGKHDDTDFVRDVVDDLVFIRIVVSGPHSFSIRSGWWYVLLPCRQ